MVGVGLVALWGWGWVGDTAWLGLGALHGGWGWVGGTVWLGLGWQHHIVGVGLVTLCG